MQGIRCTCHAVSMPHLISFAVVPLGKLYIILITTWSVATKLSRRHENGHVHRSAIVASHALWLTLVDCGAYMVASLLTTRLLHLKVWHATLGYFKRLNTDRNATISVVIQWRLMLLFLTDVSVRLLMFRRVACFHDVAIADQDTENQMICVILKQMVHFYRTCAHSTHLQ
jgi:hypothetical protein